jgi:prophage maintenance system killer protein
MSSWSPIPPFEAIQQKCIAFNREVIERYGGIATETPAEGCLERSIAAAYHAEQYAGNEDSAGLCFIGALMFFITKNQCFTDGNKRTGFALCLWLLLRFGLTLKCGDMDAANFFLAVAANEIRTREEAVVWLAQNIMAIEPEEDAPAPKPIRRIELD